MRIVQFCRDDGSNFPRVGILKNDVVIDCTHNDLPNSVVKLLNQENGYETLKRVASGATNTIYSFSSIKLLAPITKPEKILCVGLNYKEHCDEVKFPYPVEPVIFSKMASTIIGPFDNIIKPRMTEALDWEVELVAVIGKKAKDVDQESAYHYVFGYTLGQDLSARDWGIPEKNGGQWLLAKTMDNFCPLGPCLVTRDEILDPHNLKLKTWVNGVLKQNGTSSQIIHRIDKLVSYISSFMTLYPGDLIMTGSPSGTGWPKRDFLQPGDLLESEIENIGKMVNRVV